jgi:hypothetical protein
MRIRILCGLLVAASALAGCTTGDMGTGLPGVVSAAPGDKPGTQTASAAEDKHGRLDRLISAYSAAYDVPASLVHRVVRRESNYNPKAYHSGNYGLMQIRFRTAKGMGYRGSPHGRLDAETNLKYAVKYLKGAWLVAGHDEKRADRLYQTGYYYNAKRKGLLDKVGWEALAAVEPKAGPTVAAAAARTAALPGTPTVTASIEPAPARFGGAATSRTASVVTASAPASAMGYAGPAPATTAFALPDVMTAPPERPGS